MGEDFYRRKTEETERRNADFSRLGILCALRVSAVKTDRFFTAETRRTQRGQRQLQRQNHSGQNHNGRHHSLLMILSCHDSVSLLRSQRRSVTFYRWIHSMAQDSYTRKQRKRSAGTPTLVGLGTSLRSSCLCGERRRIFYRRDTKSAERPTAITKDRIMADRIIMGVIILF